MGEKSISHELSDIAAVVRRGLILTAGEATTLVDALSDRDARIAALEEGLMDLFSTMTPEHGHWTIRKGLGVFFDNAIRSLRALLTPTGTEIKDE